jgi:hypothetical protein
MRPIGIFVLGGNTARIRIHRALTVEVFGLYDDPVIL